ncbi:MAG: GAF domain-containing protein [Myxococcota bacterium]
MTDGPSDERREQRASDAPTDLVKEREQFVRNFLKKGVEFTEQLLHENQDLRQELAGLRSDNARLRAQVASDDAIRDLIRTVEALEREKNNLLEKSNELEQTQREEERRYVQVESELNDLANLYIASNQLHSSLSVRGVVRHLSDLLEQLVGAAGFVIYLMDQQGDRAVPIGWQGVGDVTPEPVATGDGPVGDACLTGVPRIREEGPLGPGTFEDPVAVIPMMVDGRPVGAICILSMLAQKDNWASVDRELFNLLGQQAGMALIAANLYDREKGPVAALAGLTEKLESQRA